MVIVYHAQNKTKLRDVFILLNHVSTVLDYVLEEFTLLPVHLHVVLFESSKNVLEISQMFLVRASGHDDIVHVTLDVGNSLKSLFRGYLPDGADVTP